MFPAPDSESLTAQGGPPRALAGPPCSRCGAPLRILLELALVTARCGTCRSMKVFAPATSPWAAVAEAGKPR